jgi:hypothetical protein
VFSSGSSRESSSLFVIISLSLDFCRKHRGEVVRFNGVFGTDGSEDQRSKS